MMTTTTSDTDEPMAGVAISLTFWLMLLAAAALFALVSLAPKLATFLALRDQSLAQQHELVQLEREQAELERVIAALEHDPLFAAEMARMEFDAVRPGEEILAVDSDLILTPNKSSPSVQPMIATSPWRPWVGILAEFQPLRWLLLAAAAVLVLIAFGWMQEKSEQRIGNSE